MCGQSVANREDSYSSGPAGIFPFRFRRQGVSPSARQATGVSFALVQTGEEELGAVPRTLSTGCFSPVKRLLDSGVRIALHDGFVLFLGDLVNSQIKPRERATMPASMACLRFRDRTAHEKGSRLDPNHFKSAAKGTCAC